MTRRGDEVVASSAVFEIRPPELSAQPDGSADIHLRYALVDAVGDSTEFTESIHLPPAEVDASAGQLLDVLAIVAGTSYFKVAAPPLLRVTFPMDSAALSLLDLVYDHGLREFAARNDLAIPLAVDFVDHENQRIDPTLLRDELAAQPADTSARPGGDLRPLVPIGGGKDSALVMSVFPDARAFAIGPPVPSVRVAEAVGQKILVATRAIDPSLRSLNDTGALNGHIPVTAITSVISAMVALRSGCSDVLMGNERSASEPTRTVDGHPVNHQFSKSLVFETALARSIDVATASAVRYFSILRPFSELAIARGLSEDDNMLDSFLSCNHAFTIWRETEQRTNATWCRNCPKCRFTALMLAPFIDPERLSSIMGGAIFDDVSQASGFAALWDIEEKPYECVGEMVESAVAMARLAEHPRWASTAVVTAVADSARRMATRHHGNLDDLLDPAPEHRVPPEYYERIAARLAPGGSGEVA